MIPCQLVFAAFVGKRLKKISSLTGHKNRVSVAPDLFVCFFFFYELDIDYDIYETSFDIY